MRQALARTVFLLSASVSTSILAQDARVITPPRVGGDVRIERLPSGMSIDFGGIRRAVIGVTLASSAPGDTAGVRVDAVDAGGPALAAGLKAGDVITAINGTSLRVSRSDADDDALSGVAVRRLQRVLARAKPGDEVELRVATSGQSRVVKVKTVSAADLNRGTMRRTVTSSGSDRQRAVIGVQVGTTGSIRDSLGLFISSVTANGPVEKSGITEGERIASVNGVDVRVPREDTDDALTATARVNRFAREVQKVAPGGQVALKVFGGGRYRDVTVTAVNASELPAQGFGMSFGNDGGRVFEFDGRAGLMRLDGEQLRVNSDQWRRDIERAVEQVRGSIQRLQIRTDRDTTGVVRLVPRRTIRVLM